MKQIHPLLSCFKHCEDGTSSTNDNTPSAHDLLVPGRASVSPDASLLAKDLIQRRAAELTLAGKREHCVDDRSFCH